MTTPSTTPAAGGDGGGYRVVAEEIDKLLPVFEQLNEDADGYEQTVDGQTSISGDQTGPKVCPEAGDALRTALQQIVGNLQTFGTHALDIRGAVQATVANYRQTDQAGADRMNNAGGSL